MTSGRGGIPPPRRAGHRPVRSGSRPPAGSLDPATSSTVAASVTTWPREPGSSCSRPRWARPRTSSRGTSSGRERPSRRPATDQQVVGRSYLAPGSADLWRPTALTTTVYDSRTPLTIEPLPSDQVRLTITAVATIDEAGHTASCAPGTTASAVFGMTKVDGRVADQAARRGVRALAQHRRLRPRVRALRGELRAHGAQGAGARRALVRRGTAAADGAGPRPAGGRAGLSGRRGGHRDPAGDPTRRRCGPGRHRRHRDGHADQQCADPRPDASPADVGPVPRDADAGARRRGGLDRGAGHRQDPGVVAAGRRVVVVRPRVHRRTNRSRHLGASPLQGHPGADQPTAARREQSAACGQRVQDGARACRRFRRPTTTSQRPATATTSPESRRAGRSSLGGEAATVSPSRPFGTGLTNPMYASDGRLWVAGQASGAAKIWTFDASKLTGGPAEVTAHLAGRPAGHQPLCHP